MNLIEFLSCGPAYGKLYTVTSQTSVDDGPVVENLYFGGFRLKFGKERVDCSQSIVPVFNLPKKDGGMSRKTRGFPLFLEFILSVEAAELSGGVSDKATVASLDDASGLANAGWNIHSLAMNNLLRLMREMNVLFPGKKVYLDPDFGCSVIQHFKHGCFSCSIIAVGINGAGNKVTFDLSDYECGDTFNDVEEDECSIENSAYILHAVMESIAEPNFDEFDDRFDDEASGRNNFFVLPETDPENISDPTIPRTPMLFRSGIIAILKKNLRKYREGLEEGC